MKHTHDLSSVDLNLLVALDVLLRVGTVTGAAQELGVTQSAMSHTLRRLRETLGDPLLVRGAAGMEATARAEALAGPLRAALREVSRVLAAPSAFDPATSERTFRLAAPDLFDALALPTLLDRFARAAPRASLAVLPGFDALDDKLSTGALDVAVIPVPADPADPSIGPPLPPHWRSRSLFDDGYTGFVRADHPVRGALDGAAFAALRHLLVSPTGHGGGTIDRWLADRGLTRHVVLRVPTFASAIAVVQQSDLVLVAPTSVAARAERLGLRELLLPTELPRHRLTLVWHPRFDADAGHVWLRAELVAATEALRSPPRAPAGGQLSTR
jgi:DNA-binding transcriptional LysR family regulator